MQRQERERERERQKLQSAEQQGENPNPFHEAVAVPLEPKSSDTSTRYSTLDYSSNLALPMPRTRPHNRNHPANRDELAPKAKGDDASSRSFTDPGNSHAEKHLSAMPKPLFSEKKSKIAMLKSKFSIENIGKKNKKSAEKDSPTTPVTPFEAEKHQKFRSSGEVSGRIPSMVSEDNSLSTTLNNDAPERVTSSNKPQIEDVKMANSKSTENPEGRFYKEYENLVVDEPRVPHKDMETTHDDNPDEHNVKGIGMAESSNITRQGTYVKCHQVQVTERQRIPSMHGVIENANLDGQKATHSRPNSVEGSSVYESVVSNRSSVENTEVRAWEQMHSAHPNTMPSFASAHNPSSTETVHRKGTNVTDPEPNQTKNAPAWPFIVSSTRPKSTTRPSTSGVSSTAPNASASAPMVSQGSTFQQDACMFNDPVGNANNHFQHPSQDGTTHAGPPEYSGYPDAPPPPTPNFQPYVPPTNTILQHLHHHLDEHGRNIGIQLASTRDYVLDQVMRRLNVIEDDVGALRQHVLLQNAQAEEIKAQMAYVSNEVFKGSEGVKATENRLVEQISNLRGITRVLSEGAPTTLPGPAAYKPVDKDAQASYIREAVRTPEPGKNENENVKTTTATAVSTNSSQENTSTSPAGSYSPAPENDVPTPTAAYRTPAKNKEDVPAGSGSVKQSGVEEEETYKKDDEKDVKDVKDENDEKDVKDVKDVKEEKDEKDEKDVFVDTPEEMDDVCKRSNTVLRVNTSIPTESATTKTTTATTTESVSATTGEDNKEATASSNASTAPADVQNTPRRRSYWPRGVRTPHSRVTNPETARSGQAAQGISGPPPMPWTMVDQSNIHPAFRTPQPNTNAQTPHRDQEREHHRNWFHSASKSRPGSHTGPTVPHIPPGPIPNTPHRGGFQQRGVPNDPQNYNPNNRNNHPFSGRGNGRGNGGGFPHNQQNNNHAMMGNNPYTFQQRVLRAEHHYDPNRGPSYPYNPPQNYPHYGPPQPNQHTTPQRPPPPVTGQHTPQRPPLPPLPNQGTPQRPPQPAQNQQTPRRPHPLPPRPAPSPSPARNQPIGGGDGSMSAGNKTPQAPPSSGPGEVPSAGFLAWYDKAYGRGKGMGK